MEAFYVSIIFLGVILVIASLFLTVMDRINGKNFFEEFDRKKDEMFNLIQDSEEMMQELNRMSDYVVTVISEKNQEFFNKSAKLDIQQTAINIVEASDSEPEEFVDKVQEELILPSVVNKEQSQISDATEQSEISEATVHQNRESEGQGTVNMQFSYNKDSLDIGKSKIAVNNKRREVLQMIEQGLSNDEISDKLKIGKGEIGLIRGLNR